jgi:hypothetical protein
MTQNASNNSDRASLVPTLIALFLISCGLLLLEISLTKIFSIVLWYHFGFLVISIALLGFATSGVWLAMNPKSLDRGGAFLAKASVWAAVGCVLALWFVIHSNVDAFSVIADQNEAGLLGQILILLLPFFFLGAVISATLIQHREHASIVYSANLVGSGIGCALAVFLFDSLHWSAPAAVLFSALLAALGGVLFAMADKRPGKGGPRAAVMPGAVVLILVALFQWDGLEGSLHLRAPKSKPLWHVENWERTHNARLLHMKSGEDIVFQGEPPMLSADEGELTGIYGEKRVVRVGEVERTTDGGFEISPYPLVNFTEWTSLSRVDAFPWVAGEAWGLWGLSDQYRGPQPRQVGITIDSWAMTNILEWKGGERGEPGEPPAVLEYLPAGLVHRVKPAADILCIGAGGGMDLLTAKRFGASKITGVELNPGVAKAARDIYPEFQGHLYDPEKNPEVTLHVAEGRHYLERDEHLYDIVQLSGVDTASTTQAGAFSLSENNLYTAEAFDTYLARTKPDGIVTLTRWFLPDTNGFPRNTLRLFVLAWEALERAGVSDPGAHLYLVESQAFSVVLFGKTAFTGEQIAMLDRTTLEKNFKPLYHPTLEPGAMLTVDGVDRQLPYEYYNPYTATVVENQFVSFAKSAQANTKDDFFSAYPYDVTSPEDNRPFFFETSRFRDLFKREAFFNALGGITAHGILMILMALLSVVALFFVIVPLLSLRAREREEGKAPEPLGAVLFYFGSLGLGFILVEVVLSQKFILYLGNPLYSLAVVLFSVLIFSGIGSALSNKVGDARRALTVVIGIAIVYPFLLDPIFNATLGLETAGRIGVAVALLAPLGLVLGMPFPLGVRALSNASSSMVAWAWGINGYTSVLGSVLCVVLSIAVGFNMVVWFGACVYLVAFAVAPKLGRKG